MRHPAVVVLLSAILCPLIAPTAHAQGNPTLDAVVASFFPANLQQQVNEDSDPVGYGLSSCYAQYDSQTVIAAYSNGVASNISVLQQQGGSYTRTVNLTANLNPGQCIVSLSDLNGDGVPDVEISFVSASGDTQDWLFTWDGTNLTNIGPTATVDGYFTSLATNSLLIDVQHDGTLQVLVPGDKTSDTPEPDVLYHLVNGNYVPAPILIAFSLVISIDFAQPFSTELPMVVPAGAHGPFVLTVINGNTQGGNRLDGTFTVNGGAATSIDTSTATLTSAVSLQQDNNTIDITTNGAAGSQAVVLVEEVAPSSVSLSSSPTSVSLPETIGIGGSVGYSVSGLPAGVTAQFSAPAVSGYGDTVITFITSATASAGSASIVVTATNADTGQTQSIPLTLQISGSSTPAGFTLTASTTLLSLAAPGSNVLAVTQSAPPAFNDDVTYSAVGLPIGLSATFTPSDQVGSGTLALTFTALSTVQPGTYSISIIGSDQQTGAGQVVPLQITVAKNSLPSGWNDQDIGAVGTGGTASSHEGVFSIQGAGCGEASTCDEANFAYQTVQSSWSSVVRITAGPNGSGMIGLMARDNLAPNSNEVSIQIIGGASLLLTSRNNNVWSSSGPVAVTLPLWLKFSRVGNNFTAFYSSDGATWSQLGSSVSVPVNNTIAYTGVFIGSGNGSLASGSFDSVSSASWTLPSGWADSDIGSVGVSGSAISSSGLFIVQGSGCGFTSDCEQFHYVYATLPGDWSIVAQLSSMAAATTNGASGLVIRDSLDTAANEVALLMTNGATLTLSSRTNSLWTSNASMSGVSSPVWLRLTRSGNNISAYVSPDGMTWSEVGSAVSVSFGQPIYAGLAVSSGDNTALATSVFSNVLLTPFVLAASSDVSITAASPVTTIITETADNAFTDPVRFALFNAPPGLTGAFSSPSLTGSGSTTLSLLVSPTVPSGYYPVAVAGTDPATGVAQYATFILNVQPLSVPAAAPVVTVPIGSSGSVTVTETIPTSITNGVTFYVDGMTADITAVVTPTALSTSGNVTVTISADANVSAGSYPLILRGTDSASGTLVLNTIIILIVPPSLSDFPETVNATEQVPAMDGSEGPTASSVTINSAPGSMLSSVSPWNAYNAWNWNPYGSVPGTAQTYIAYSSYDPALYSRSGGGAAQAWQEINWVLNNKDGASWNLYPTIQDIQLVIYDLLIPGYDTADLTSDGAQLLSDAQTYGPYFVPSPGQTIAIVLYFSGINQSTPPAVPDVLIEYTVPGGWFF